MGIGIIYISHGLAELQQIAERVAVFRDGQSVACFNVADITNEHTVDRMVGREIV